MIIIIKNSRVEFQPIGADGGDAHLEDFDTLRLNKNLEQRESTEQKYLSLKNIPSPTPEKLMESKTIPIHL
jgi:hypothetical protein